MKINKSIYIGLPLILTLFHCTPSNELVNQMKISETEGEINLQNINEWEEMGLPVIVMSTSDTSNITALFVAEASGNARIAQPTGLTVRSIIQVRIVINDEIASPSQTSFMPLADFTNSPIGSSLSFMAVLRKVPPGTVEVRVQWKALLSVDNGPKIKSRTLAVWQTVEQ